MAAKPRSEVKNSGTPAGDFAEFLRKALPSKFKREGETNDDARQRFITAIVVRGASSVGVEAVRKWEQGIASPPLKDLGAIAEAFGYRDWYALVAAVKSRK